MKIIVVFAIALVILGAVIVHQHPFTTKKSDELKSQEISYSVDATDSLIRSEMFKIAEQAYFEGQKDAIEGDIRITKKDSVYIWTKSCWDNGPWPIYNPTKEDSK